jgi:hypothetical protein
MSERLKLLNDPRFLGIKPWRTDRYDNLKIPETVTYRVTGKKDRDTPPIHFTSAPRINILATSSEEWFFNNLLTEDSAGGFVPRWVLVRAGNTGRIVPIPKMPDSALVQPLADHPKQASELAGTANLSQIARVFRSWYGKTKQRFASQPNRMLADAYFNRHRVHILKLAVIYEVSSSLSLTVSPRSWARAVKFARQLEVTILSLLTTGMSGSGYKANQMAERVRSVGEEGMTLSEFTRSFQHTDKRQRESYLNTLVIGETIFGFKRPTHGRLAHILVHRDFVESYRAHHPDENLVQIRYGS